MASAWNTIPCPSPSCLPASAASWNNDNYNEVGDNEDNNNEDNDNEDNDNDMPRGLPQKMDEDG